MTDDYHALRLSDFRLNFELQQRRPKDFLKQAGAEEPAAAARVKGKLPKLARRSL